ncbi:MAG: DNA methyltransferase, partial [Actinomycetota bacterium]
MTQTSISITKSKDKPSPFIDRELVSKLTDAEKNLRILGNDLTFADIPEYKRTKHVHRLHPYLGKFIPQLVEVFLKKCFKPGDIILDPLVGSGTTLVETNILGMPSIGIELSRFNCLISKVKIKKYDMSLLEFEIKDILDRVKA